MEVQIEIKKTKAFAELEDGAYYKRFMSLLGDDVLKRWDKSSASENFWELGIHDMRDPKPLPDKLTQRTGRLVNSVKKKGANEGIRFKSFSGDDMILTKGSTVEYANRQERQQGNRRSFLQTSLIQVLSEMDNIKKNVLRKMREELK